MESKNPSDDSGEALRLKIYNHLCNKTTTGDDSAFPAAPWGVKETKELRSGHELLFRDAQTVVGESWFSSEAINFYGAILLKDQADSAQPGTTVILDSQFAKVLLDNRKKNPKLFRWVENTMKANNVKHGRVFIFPVNVSDSHWYIVVAVIESKTSFSLRIMDSMLGHYLSHQRNLFARLRSFFAAFTARTPVSQPENKAVLNLFGDVGCETSRGYLHGNTFAPCTASLQGALKGSSDPIFTPLVNPSQMRAEVIEHLRKDGDPDLQEACRQIYATERDTPYAEGHLGLYCDNRKLPNVWWDHID